MAFKEWFRKLHPMQLYIMLVLTCVFFTVELVISHFTHSLTLLVDSYHMLCNMIAIAGCILTIKKLHLAEAEAEASVTGGVVMTDEDRGSKTSPQLNCLGQVVVSNEVMKCTQSMKQYEKSLKNTFGWARIDILVMLIGCIFLASLSFSLLVEALQTLTHIDHHDEMHYPMIVFSVALVGLVINGICYLLIGGYTFHQGSYMHVTPAGEVVLQRAVTADSVRRGERRLSSQSRRKVALPPTQPMRQGPREMIRDVIGCIFVIIGSLVVYFTSGHAFAKYFDPILSIISAISLLVLSYPYMKESGLILLQTIPDHIDIESLRSQLLQAFPDIVNIHDLHVWQFTADKIFSTAHIIFLNPREYLRITKELNEFFYEQGITQVTIQAEFIPETESVQGKNAIINSLNSGEESRCCLMQCLTEECRKRHCCVNNEQSSLEIIKVETVRQQSQSKEPGEPGEQRQEVEEPDVVDIKL